MNDGFNNLQIMQDFGTYDPVQKLSASRNSLSTRRSMTPATSQRSNISASMSSQPQELNGRAPSKVISRRRSNDPVKPLVDKTKDLHLGRVSSQRNSSSMRKTSIQQKEKFSQRRSNDHMQPFADETKELHSGRVSSRHKSSSSRKTTIEQNGELPILASGLQRKSKGSQKKATSEQRDRFPATKSKSQPRHVNKSKEQRNDKVYDRRSSPQRRVSSFNEFSKNEKQQFPAARSQSQFMYQNQQSARVHSMPRNLDKGVSWKESLDADMEDDLSQCIDDYEEKAQVKSNQIRQMGEFNNNDLKFLSDLAKSAFKAFKNAEFNIALDQYRLVKSHASQMLGNNHTVVADALVRMGLIYEATGNLTLALHRQHDALRIYEMNRNNFGDDHTHSVKVTSTLTNIGNFNSELGDLDSAFSCFKEVMREMQLLGLDKTRDGTVSVISLYKNIGNVLSRKGDFKAAMGALTEALKLQRDIYGETHKHFAITLNDIGEILCKDGRDQEAFEAFQETLMIYRMNKLTDDESCVVRVIENMSNVASKKKNSEGLASKRFLCLDEWG